MQISHHLSSLKSRECATDSGAKKDTICQRSRSDEGANVPHPGATKETMCHTSRSQCATSGSHEENCNIQEPWRKQCATDPEANVPHPVSKKKTVPHPGATKETMCHRSRTQGEKKKDKWKRRLKLMTCECKPQQVLVKVACVLAQTWWNRVSHSLTWSQALKESDSLTSCCQALEECHSLTWCCQAFKECHSLTWWYQ